MFYYTYVLRSTIDDKLYIGWTLDLVARLKKHNSGMVKSTSSRKPLILLYYEACRSKEKAIAREKYFKTGFGRKFLASRL